LIDKNFGLDQSSSPKDVFIVPGEEFGAGLKLLVRGEHVVS